MPVYQKENPLEIVEFFKDYAFTVTNQHQQVNKTESLLHLPKQEGIW